MLQQSTHATSFAHHLLTWVHGLPKSRVSACLAVLGSMYMYMFEVTPAIAAVEPVITVVTTDYQVNPPTITINGRYFGSVTPSVTLDGATVVVVTYTQAQVTALLPANLSPGSYQLVLTNRVTDLQADVYKRQRHRTAPDGLLVEKRWRARRGVDRQLNGPRLQQVHRVGAAFIHLEHDLARQSGRAQHRSCLLYTS